MGVRLKRVKRRGLRRGLKRGVNRRGLMMR